MEVGERSSCRQREEWKLRPIMRSVTLESSQRQTGWRVPPYFLFSLILCLSPWPLVLASFCVPLATFSPVIPRIQKKKKKKGRGKDTCSLGFHLINLREGRIFLGVVPAWLRLSVELRVPLWSGYWSALSAETWATCPLLQWTLWLAGVPEPHRNASGWWGFIFSSRKKMAG